MRIKKGHNPQTFSDAEIALLKEGLKRSYKERLKWLRNSIKYNKHLRKRRLSINLSSKSKKMDIFDEGILNFWRI